MGQSKRKKNQFFAAHRNCCFCGGARLATTIDHVPPRVCFLGRAFPDGFEFPSCDACQTSSRKAEQVLGFFSRLLDWNESNYDSLELKKLIEAAKNNFPEFLPNAHLRANQKRDILRRLGFEKDNGLFLSEIPLVAIPTTVNKPLSLALNKLACALFYREMSRPAPSEYMIWTHWTTADTRTSLEGIQSFIDMTPLLREGTRRNLDFGDRFRYRCNKGYAPDVLATVSQFGQGLISVSVIVDAQAFSEITPSASWKSIGVALADF